VTITLTTHPHIDNDGSPSKRITMMFGSGDDTQTITVALGVAEARALSAALKPNGRDILLANGVLRTL
jgi:hypothetical protein